MTESNKWFSVNMITIWMKVDQMKYYRCRTKLPTRAGLALSIRVISWRRRPYNPHKTLHSLVRFKTWSMHLVLSITTISLWWKINYSTTRTLIQTTFLLSTLKSTTSAGPSLQMSYHLECHSATCLCSRTATGPITMSDWAAIHHRHLPGSKREKAIKSRTRRSPSPTVTQVSYAKRARAVDIAPSMST